MKHIVYLGIGSNLGDREQLLRQAIMEIDKQVGSVVRQSAFLETEPQGFTSTHTFLNAAVCCETDLSPRQLLSATQHIEWMLGKRPQHATGHAVAGHQAPAYHDRPVDIDILMYDDLTIDTPELTIPHPRMQERDFVMIPLREIMP